MYWLLEPSKHKPAQHLKVSLPCTHCLPLLRSSGNAEVSETSPGWGLESWQGWRESYQCDRSESPVEWFTTSLSGCKGREGAFRGGSRGSFHHHWVLAFQEVSSMTIKPSAEQTSLQSQSSDAQPRLPMSMAKPSWSLLPFAGASVVRLSLLRFLLLFSRHVLSVKHVPGLALR